LCTVNIATGGTILAYDVVKVHDLEAAKPCRAIRMAQSGANCACWTADHPMASADFLGRERDGRGEE
jgi:hypothetical protein